MEDTKLLKQLTLDKWDNLSLDEFLKNMHSLAPQKKRRSSHIVDSISESESHDDTSEMDNDEL